MVLEKLWTSLQKSFKPQPPCEENEVHFSLQGIWECLKSDIQVMAKFGTKDEKNFYSKIYVQKGLFDTGKERLIDLSSEGSSWNYIFIRIPLSPGILIRCEENSITLELATFVFSDVSDISGSVVRRQLFIPRSPLMVCFTVLGDDMLRSTAGQTCTYRMASEWILSFIAERFMKESGA